MDFIFDKIIWKIDFLLWETFLPILLNNTLLCFLLSEGEFWQWRHLMADFFAFKILLPKSYTYMKLLGILLSKTESEYLQKSLICSVDGKRKNKESLRNKMCL